MMYALNLEGKRVLATKGALASCPACSAALVPKCGKINAHHWAHLAGDCDSWVEPESKWHLNWKAQFEDKNVEVTMGNHRADIVTNRGYVIELQHSSISVEEIKEREAFYKNMVWVFDARELWKSKRIIARKERAKGEFLFSVKWPRKHYLHCDKDVYLDIGVGLVQVTWFNPKGKYFYGHVGSYEDFLSLPIFSGSEFIKEIKGA